MTDAAARPRYQISSAQSKFIFGCRHSHCCLRHGQRTLVPRKLLASDVVLLDAGRPTRYAALFLPVWARRCLRTYERPGSDRPKGQPHRLRCGLPRRPIRVPASDSILGVKQLRAGPRGPLAFQTLPTVEPPRQTGLGKQLFGASRLRVRDRFSVLPSSFFLNTNPCSRLRRTPCAESRRRVQRRINRD